MHQAEVSVAGVIVSAAQPIARQRPTEFHYHGLESAPERLEIGLRQRLNCLRHGSRHQSGALEIAHTGGEPPVDLSHLNQFVGQNWRSKSQGAAASARPVRTV